MNRPAAGAVQTRRSPGRRVEAIELVTVPIAQTAVPLAVCSEVFLYDAAGTFVPGGGGVPFRAVLAGVGWNELESRGVEHKMSTVGRHLV